MKKTKIIFISLGCILLLTGCMSSFFEPSGTYRYYSRDKVIFTYYKDNKRIKVEEYYKMNDSENFGTFKRKGHIPYEIKVYELDSITGKYQQKEHYKENSGGSW